MSGLTLKLKHLRFNLRQGVSGLTLKLKHLRFNLSQQSEWAYVKT